MQMIYNETEEIGANKILRNVLRRSSIVDRTALVFVPGAPSFKNKNEFLLNEQMFWLRSTF